MYTSIHVSNADAYNNTKVCNEATQCLLLFEELPVIVSDS